MPGREQRIPRFKSSESVSKVIGVFWPSEDTAGTAGILIGTVKPVFESALSSTGVLASVGDSLGRAQLRRSVLLLKA